MIKRLGLVGDIHGEAQRLERALDAMTSAGVCSKAHVGDVVDGPGNVERCIDLLKDHQVMGVAGNHERWFLAGSSRGLPDATQELSDPGREFLAALPSTRTLSTSQGGVLLCHGLGEDDMVVLKSHDRGYALQTALECLRPFMMDPAIQWLACGHTHERMVRSFSGLTIVNAGTLSDSGPPGFMILDFEVGVAETWNILATSIERSTDLPIT